MADEVKLTYISGLSGLTANVFSGDGNIQRNSGNVVTLSDTGHLGLYLGDCADIKAGDVIIFFLNDVYLTGQTYRIVSVSLVTPAEGAVLDIGICNLALNLLGAKEISTDRQTEVNYLLCEDLYPEARNEILASHPWNFARKRAGAIQTTDPLFGPDNAFTRPSDCLRILTIVQDHAADWRVEGNLILTDEGEAPTDYDDGGVDYLAGQYLSYSDVTYLVDTAFTSSDWTTDLASYMTSQNGDYQYLEIEYIYLASDATNYPPFLRQCVIYNLAIKLSSPIKQDEKVALNLQQMLYGGPKLIGYLDTARSTDAHESGVVTIKTGAWIGART